MGYNISDAELLTKEEENKIEEILNNSLFYAFNPNNEESSIVSRMKIQNKNELKIKISFMLRYGSFEFWKNTTNEVLDSYDCFSLSYKNLSFVYKNSDKFDKYECNLREIYLEMFSIEKNKKNKIYRLSYLNNQEILHNNPFWNQGDGFGRYTNLLTNIEEIFVWKISFKQFSQDSNINSDLKIELVKIFFIILLNIFLGYI